MRLQHRAIRLIASVLVCVCMSCAAKQTQPLLQGEPHGPDDVIRASVRRLQRGEGSRLTDVPVGNKIPQLALTVPANTPSGSAYPILEPAQIIPVWLLPQRREWGDFAGGQWVFLTYKEAAFRDTPRGRVAVPVTPTLAPIETRQAPTSKRQTPPGSVSTPTRQTAPDRIPTSEAISRQVQAQLRQLQQSMGMHLTLPQIPGTRAKP